LPNYVARVGWPAESQYEPGVLYRLTPSGPAYATEAETVAAINAASVAQYDDADRPLPLLGHWHRTNLPLSWQLTKISEGIPLLPWMNWSKSTIAATNEQWGVLAEKSLPFLLLYGQEWDGELVSSLGPWASYPLEQTARQITFAGNVVSATAVGSTGVVIELDVPHGISTTGGRWFSGFTGDWDALNGTYYDVSRSTDTAVSLTFDASGFAAYSENGGVMVRGTAVISNMGTTDPWLSAGETWTDNTPVQNGIAQYASPPRVFMTHNNEASWLNPGSSAEDWRFVQAYGAVTTAAQKYRHCYDLRKSWLSAFVDGMKNGMPGTAWESGLTACAYNNAPARDFRCGIAWYGGARRTTVSESFYEFAWQFEAYGGGQWEMYDADANDWSASYPGNCKAPWLAWSPQNEAMNYAWQRDIALYHNPNYWHEVLVWDGGMVVGMENPPLVVGIEDIYSNGDGTTTVVTSAAHGWASTAVRGFGLMVGDWAALNSGSWAITVIDATTLTIPFNSAGFGAYTSGGEIGVQNKGSLYRWKGIPNDNPDFYKGWTQYCMWAAKARVLREYRGSARPVHEEPYYSYWQVVMDAVCHVHQHPQLRRFWRFGVLVENTTPIGNGHPHPFQNTVQSTDGTFTANVWFDYPKNYNLATNLDPTYGSRIELWRTPDMRETPVYTMAHVIGTTPNREYLIYAHSTGIAGDASKTITDLAVTIPGYDTVTLPEVPIGGAFYYIKEAA
jgi:hypothetical protein